MDEAIDPKNTSHAPGESHTKTADQLLLRIGERLFHTSLDTLVSQCQHFEPYHSGRWQLNLDGDGALFIDADPDAFEHILRFCRTGVFPLCWTKETGHDYVLYARIQEAAAFFMCDKLLKWLENRWYQLCVTVESRRKYLSSSDLWGSTAETSGNEHVMEVHFIEHSGIKTDVYICPRNISSHYDKPGRCGKDCRKSTNDPGTDSKYELDSVLETRRTVKFNPAWMTENG